MSHLSSTLVSPERVHKQILADPSWCLTPLPSFSNELPLHQSILNAAPFEVTSIILNSNPAAVVHADDGGNTPLHCACAVGDLEVVTLLLQHGADPSCSNKDKETPLAILNTTNLNHVHPDIVVHIQEALELQSTETKTKNERTERRHKREQLWSMTEEQAWFYAAIHGSVPLNSSHPALEKLGVNVSGMVMSGVNIIHELSNEEKFDVFITTVEQKDAPKGAAKEAISSTGSSSSSSGSSRHLRQYTAMQLACLHLHPGIVQALLPVFKKDVLQIRSAIGIIEGIITSVIVDNELSTLTMHQSENIRAPPSAAANGRAKNKWMKKNGKMKKMKRGDTTNDTDTDIGQRKQWQANTSDTEKFSLNEATAILRMLTKGKHALFD